MPFPDGGTLTATLSPGAESGVRWTGALVGKGADPTAISVAAEHQLSLEGHCARQISRRLCRNYDLILTMEKRHIERLCEMAPEMRGKVMLFGHWDNEVKSPIRIAKAGKRLQRCTHYLNGLPASGRRH